jgi:hypothetical protein
VVVAIATGIIEAVFGHELHDLQCALLQLMFGS